MTDRSYETGSPRRARSVATSLLLLLVATTGSACSWLTGEFATLDRVPPSVTRPDEAPERP